jgi:hypothetical protein
MAAQIEECVDLGDAHVLRTICDPCDLVASSNLALFQYTKIKTRTVMGDQQGRHSRLYLRG